MAPQERRGDSLVVLLLAERAASEGWGGSRQTILLARRTRTMKLCSFDARSEGQPGDSPGREGVTVQSRKQEALVGRAH
jgi:hypothetical protein